MMSLLLIALLALAVPLVDADPTQLRLFHRLYHPAAAHAQFSERGSVLVAGNNSFSFQPSPSFSQDLFAFAEAFHTVKDKNLLLYQVALERDADTAISSVKACHLHQATSESIYIHALDTHNPKPHALDYFVSPIPHDGACPKSRSKKSTKHAFQPPSFESFASVKSTVILKSSHFPPLPQLATPPPISPEGEPIVPVPEKSFLQKYWMYIAGFLVVTILTGGGEEGKPKK
ncbi:hypothetical protein D9615_000525 [Tricholomella constricta]|uniref:ER membrane protein complex subunit 10 n=1 Tax=Tricholomella constricta TaxID=117010 RepID=A0A8H5HQY6_9AGAR|nr:hypothetical protein D9615_000525 [Tricholomella constricta]